MKCTGRNCPMQYGTVDPAHCSAADECPYVTKPLTNADRFRAMSDEELAKYFSYIAECDHCQNELDRECCVNEDVCINRWLEWLKSEA